VSTGRCAGKSGFLPSPRTKEDETMYIGGGVLTLIVIILLIIWLF
jgi:hypothetical protein